MDKPIPEAVVERAIDALCREWNLHPNDAMRMVELVLTAAQQQGQANPWQLAVDHERVTAHLGIAAEGVTREEAAKQLGELIDWHVKVATDPAVNGGFRLMPMQQGGGEVTVDGVTALAAEKITLTWAEYAALRDTTPPSAPVGVDEIWDAPALPEKWDSSRGYVEGWNDCRNKFATLAKQPAACPQCFDGEVVSTDPYAESEPCPKCKPAQQPAAVDEAMVNRALNAYFATQSMLVWKNEKLIKAMEAALTAALATQHQESTT